MGGLAILEMCILEYDLASRLALVFSSPCGWWAV